MNVLLERVLKQMDEVDKTLQCTDFNGTVTVTHQDGSIFKLQNAIAKSENIDGWDILKVWTEHCGFFAFFISDLETYSID